MAALGMNTVDTYIPWNFHQPKRSAQPCFDGWRDVERFISLAGGLGLDVIVRPGPYICAEWDNGGLPAWLTASPGIQLRSTDQRFLEAVGSWFDVVVPRIAALQRSNGGPVIAVQVENEYGSYADDAGYLDWMLNALTSRGITELLYTADGPTDLMQDAGSVPGVLATATLGSRATEARELLASRRSGEPFMVAEFWNGWFDHWGERHHVRSARSAAETLGDIVDAGGSVSVYMAHGGTNFGLWAGANHDGSRLQPTVTSYDSDAAIAENGALTPKFFALRERLLGPDAPALDRLDGLDSPAVLPASSLTLTPRSGLLGALRASAAPFRSQRPASFEQLDQPSGLVLYRALPLVPEGEHVLSFTGVHDRAQVFVEGEAIGTIDAGAGEFRIVGDGRPASVEVLVENQGRINYGPLLGQGKGILGHVQIDRRLVLGWEAIGLPLDEWNDGCLSAAREAAAPSAGSGFATALLEVDEPADAFLAFPGFGKGFAWIGDFLLGRYWSIGPQETLYVPAPLLTRGTNLITVLELERFGDAIEVRDAASLGPEEEYVEEFS
ncbi:beta-galactosidase [Humibacter antri]